MKLKALIVVTLTLLGCSRSDSPRKNTPFIGFPQPGPVAGADPTKREAHRIRVPKKLQIERADGILVFTCDTSAMDTVDVSIGYQMRVGFFLDVCKKIDTEKVLIRHGQVSGEDVTRLLDYAQRTDSRRITPAIGIGVDITFFETNIPEQHMWNPWGGKDFQVLWEKSYQTDSQF